VTPTTHPSGAVGRTAGWLQMNVALERVDGQAVDSARAVFAALSPCLRGWRRGGVVQRFFFMRKAPDMRLRFLSPEPDGVLRPELTSLLKTLRRDGWVQRFFPSVYEPEVFQFGGREAMDLVHTYFDVDSLAWMEMDRLWAAGTATARADQIVLAVANDLFLRVLEDTGEVWDVWCNLVALRPAAEAVVPGPVPILFIDSLLPDVTRPEAAILARYAKANQRLATGLQRVWSRGRLLSGLRAILPFVALFHFNRYGIDGPTQAALAGAMQQAWSPKHGLRGEWP
jgi:thiopeptide-type bacteriocin biosynthesis protein